MRTVHVRDASGTGAVEVLTAGHGDPLVFLQGWGLTPQVYAPAMLRLCAVGISVIAPALPGCAGSTPLPVRHLTLPGYADRIAAALDALDLAHPAFVVGHSLGGGIAVELARRRPDLVRALTLVNTVGGAPGSGGMSTGSWLRWAVGAAGELQPGAVLRLAPSGLRAFLPNAARHPLATALSGLLAVRASLAAEAGALVDGGLPVLFIWSDRDRLITPGVLRQVSGTLPAEVVRGRHGWLLTSPEEFAELLRNALTVHAMLERRSRGQAVV
ncbi:MAG TPA: alpha/beta hydrolase, partial [Mycobacteriales bacterium]|nr:alpha/beta hydrolase [Mycobacteriales bacterium]